MTTTATPPALPARLAALHLIADGEIGTFDATAPLRHRTRELPPQVFSALLTARRDRLVKLNPPDPRDGWRTATLTRTGTALLRRWIPDTTPTPTSRPRP